MSLFQKIKNAFSFSDDNAGLVNWQDLLGSNNRRSITGTFVDRQIALSLGAVYRGTDLISSTIGRSSCIVYQQGNDNNRTHHENHSAYRLLYGRANSITPSILFVENLVSSALLSGNGFAYIERDETGNPASLWNLDGESVTVVVVYTGDSLVPQIRYLAQGIGNYGNSTQVALRPDEIIHLKGLGSTPFIGQGLLNVARETIGLQSDASQFASFYLNNSGVLQTIVDCPTFKTDEQKKAFVEQFETRHNGAANSFRPAFVPPGTKVSTLAVDADKYALDALSDRLDRAIANFLGLPPHKVAVPGVGSSYGSIDAENASLNGDVYDKWFTRLESELENKLLTEIEKATGKAFVEFDRSTLLAADPDAYATRITNLYNNGLLSWEESRLDLNRPTTKTGEFKTDTPAPAAIPAAPTTKQGDKNNGQ